MDDRTQFVAGAGYDEVGFGEAWGEASGGLYEVLRAFLVGDPAQEGDDLAAAGRPALLAYGDSLEQDCIVDDPDFLGGMPYFSTTMERV